VTAQGKGRWARGNWQLKIKDKSKKTKVTNGGTYNQRFDILPFFLVTFVFCLIIS